MRVTLFGGRLAQAGTGPATTIAATKYQSFRLTCGAGRIYRTEHKQGALSAARARYFVFAQRIFHTPQAYFIAPQAPPRVAKKEHRGFRCSCLLFISLFGGGCLAQPDPKEQIA